MSAEWGALIIAAALAGFAGFVWWMRRMEHQSGMNMDLFSFIHPEAPDWPDYNRSRRIGQLGLTLICLAGSLFFFLKFLGLA